MPAARVEECRALPKLGIKIQPLLSNMTNLGDSLGFSGSVGAANSSYVWH